MSVALLVIGNGRLEYLHDTVEAALTYLPEMDHYLMVDDSGDTQVQRELRNYGDFYRRHHGHNKGMAAAVQSGFDMVLDTDADFVFWLEEDMTLQQPIPVEEAISTLTHHPHVAQILFPRQPLNPVEFENGGVCGHFASLPDSVDHGPWVEHRWIFSMNPCLIPRNVLELGYDTGNEAGMTKKLLQHGFTFGCWKGDWTYTPGTGRRAKNWQL